MIIYLYLCEISDNNNSTEIHIRTQLITSVDYIMTNHIFSLQNPKTPCKLECPLVTNQSCIWYFETTLLHYVSLKIFKGEWYQWFSIRHWTTYRFCLRITCSPRRSCRSTVHGIFRLFTTRSYRTILRYTWRFFWSSWSFWIPTRVRRTTSCSFFCWWFQIVRTVSRRFWISWYITWSSWICMYVNIFTLKCSYKIFSIFIKMNYK